MSETLGYGRVNYTLIESLNIPEEQKYALLETYFRVMRKIDSASFKKERLLGLLIEEIAFLLDIIIVRINGNPNLAPKSNILSCEFFAPGMNIIDEDYAILESAFDPVTLRRQCLMSDKTTWRILEKPIGAGNRTIRFIDSLIVLPFREVVEGRASIPVGTIEIYYASDGQDVIKRDGSAAEMLKQIRKDIQSDFVKGLCCVLSEVLDNTKRRARESKDNTEELNILSSVRSRKLDFIKTHYSRQQDFDKNTFVEDYHKYFGPLDKVFSNLLMQFGLRVAIYFSYRLPSDDHLSYFFTTEQVETLLSKRRLSIEDFEHLWTYPYQRGGLNGYIMNTKNPIYLPNMHLDDRWTLLMKEPDRTDTITKYDSKRQKQLLLKMFDLSEAPLHTYIVPILVAYNCGKEPALLVAMHCTTADPIPHDLRKHMFDLAWEASAGVETALLAQWASEKRFESETEKLILRALLAAGVGHDLRGPLQDIKNELVFLKKQVHPKTPEIENSLSNAERQLYFSLKVAWDILDYYVGKDLKEKLVIKEVALRNVIENSLSHLRIAGDIKIVKNIDPTLKVQLDSDRMARVFINLVNNACNSFEGMQGSQKEIKFVGEDLGERICIEIADTGSGIEKEDIHKIFLPNVSKKNEKGIGIGLLIVQAIIKAHQGNITVDSEVGKGTTVKICLPKKQGKEGVKCKVIQE